MTTDAEPCTAHASRASCAACGRPLSPGAFFVVRVDVFADPTPEPISLEKLHAVGAGGGAGHEATVAGLLAQMATMTDEELQDAVARRFEYVVCPACQKLILANPLGLPRRRNAPSRN